MSRAVTASAWAWVMICVAVVVLSCGLKNYLAVLVTGTAWCPYLCPSWFAYDTFDEVPVLAQLFAAQRYVEAQLQGLVDRVWPDVWNLGTRLLFAPLVEESLYRGPLYLARAQARRPWWWLVGALLVVAFALSHGRSGLALVPLLVLGLCSLWLIRRTGRFWPSIMLHVLHNFFFTSAIVYRSLWASD